MLKRTIGAIYALDQFVRFYQLGFVAVWPLLGWACVMAWSSSAVVALVVVSLCFNTYGAVLNDVVNLDIDRRDPLKVTQWLVRGRLTTRQALGVALIQLPVMIAVHLAAGFPTGALTPLLGAVVGQGLYDIYGKRCPVPPLMEAGEAAAAFLLVVYGTMATGEPISPLMWPTAIASAAFILLVNAFHGGLRDIDVEIGSDEMTTPIWLGCRGVCAGTVHISRTMSAYAGLCQTIVIVVSLFLAARLASADTRVGLIVAVVGASVVNVVLLVLLHRVRKPAWDVLLRLHVLTVMLPVMLAFVSRLGAPHSITLFAIYLAPNALVVYWWLDTAAVAVLSRQERSLADSIAPGQERRAIQ